jgi:hypothetical protein
LLARHICSVWTTTRAAAATTMERKTEAFPRAVVRICGGADGALPGDRTRGQGRRPNFVPCFGPKIVARPETKSALQNCRCFCLEPKLARKKRKYLASKYLYLPLKKPRKVPEINVNRELAREFIPALCN